MSTKSSVERYKLVEFLGEGGMGEVWRAERTLADGWKQQVAIKRIRPEYACELGAIRRLDKEGRASVRLNHQYVVKVFDYIRHGAERRIVMEYVDGLSLDELKGWAVLSHEMLWRIFSQVVFGLDHIHAGGYLHRDISPANIMITRNGEVKILDLGLIKQAGEPRSGESFLGTAPYASQEALEGEDLDCSSDLYSLAAVIFELLAGSPPYGRKDRATIRSRQRKGEREPLPEQVPDDFRVLLGGLLEPRKARIAKTTGDVHELLAALWADSRARPGNGDGLADAVRRAMALCKRRDQPRRVSRKTALAKTVAMPASDDADHPEENKPPSGSGERRVLPSRPRWRRVRQVAAAFVFLTAFALIGRALVQLAIDAKPPTVVIDKTPPSPTEDVSERRIGGYFVDKE